jgi:hypothetical protein
MRNVVRKATFRPSSLPRLGDFTTDRRVLILLAMAVADGYASNDAA